MTDKNQVTKCPCCGSMLRIDWGTPDFPGVENTIGTCSFCPVDVRNLEQAQHDLELTISALNWIAENRLADNSVRIEQLRRHARAVLAQINKKGK